MGTIEKLAVCLMSVLLCAGYVLFNTDGYFKYSSYETLDLPKFIQKETGGLLSLKDMYRNLCNETLPKNNTETISDIVLIVLFNFPNFSIIPLLEILLRPLFTRIVYCGFNPSDNETSKNMKTFRNSGIEIITYPEPEGTTPGGFSMGQNCPVLVMKRMKDVQGYFILGDDVLIAPHKIHELYQNKTALWKYTFPENYCGHINKNVPCSQSVQGEMPCDCKSWRSAFKSDKHNKRYVNALKVFYNRSTTFGGRYKRCKDNLERITGAPWRMITGYSDIYYIPRELADDFVTITNIFIEHDVFMSTSDLTVLAALSKPGKTMTIRGTTINGKLKPTPWIPMRKTFPDLTFLHPVKWSPILQDSTPHTDFYCKVVVPWMYNSKAKVPNFTPKKYSQSSTFAYKGLTVLN